MITQKTFTLYFYRLKKYSHLQDFNYFDKHRRLFEVSRQRIKRPRFGNAILIQFIMNQKDTITHILTILFTFVVGTLNPLCNIIDKITESRLFSTSASSNKTQINVMCKTLYILFQCKTSRKSNNEDFDSSLNIYQNGKVIFSFQILC